MANPLNAKAIAGELARENFDDERLTKRLQNIIEGVARDPQASLPSVLSSAELEGAYRFFSNPLVTPEAILMPHFEATKVRAARETRVRVVHDQTEFSYRRQGKRQGLGDRAYQGFSGHFSLVLSGEASRRPLGLAGLHTWARGNGEKEQALWLKQIELTARFLDCGAKAIHICDRGSEDYVLFDALIARAHRFVIRTAGKRWTESGPEGSRMMLRDVLATIEHVSERTARINGRKRHSGAVLRKIHPPRKPRTVTLHIAATTVELARPSNYGKRGTPGEHLGHLPMTLPLNVVRVWEPTAPDGEQPIEWILFTNEPIATAEDAVAVVDHYRARWTIEEYFKALKTGCAFESRQLHDYEALTNALAVFAPLAFQILLLRTVARDVPDAPAHTVASAEQVEVLRRLGRRPLPASPTTRDILLAIAALGGHIKYAPDPGWLTIARGYEKLDAYVAGWRAAKLQSGSDQR
jgi:hypothetical protein